MKKRNRKTERNQNVFEMRKAGYKYREIAEKHGISIIRVRQILDAHKEEVSMTNEEKFKEVFGHDPDIYECILSDVECDQCRFKEYGRQCSVKRWGEGYKSTKE